MREIDDDDEPAQLDVNIDGDEDQPSMCPPTSTRTKYPTTRSIWMTSIWAICPRWTMTVWTTIFNRRAVRRTRKMRPAADTL